MSYAIKIWSELSPLLQTPDPKSCAFFTPKAVFFHSNLIWGTLTWFMHVSVWWETFTASHVYTNFCSSLTSPPKYAKVGDTTVTFMSVQNLVFIVTADMTHDRQITADCQSAYYELSKISAICHILSAWTAVNLVCVFVLSRLDYC